MRREYKIKWTESQWRRLDSAVRRYNNAIRRELAKTPNSEIYLPQEASYKELKSSITTSRALKNVVNRLSRITREGALQPVRQNDGSIVTRYERHEYAVLKSVRERKKRMEAMKYAEDAKKHTIGSYEQNAATPDRRSPSELSAKGLRRFIETQSREMDMSSVERARRYLKNYLTALDTVFGGFEQYKERIDDIKRNIENGIASGNERLLEWVRDSPAIRFIYDPYERDMKMDVLTEYWSRF